jgi:AcrR family transcriptional regulator
VLAVVLRDGLICVAQRSASVGTSRGLWSVVTGYLENGIDPLDQVCVELEEELGLLSGVPISRDRRQRRRQQTLAEILDVAAQVMAEHGAGGLTLGEVARRLGMRPPSLYVYFASKHALYDALFAQGWRAVLAEMARSDQQLIDAGDLGECLLCMARTFVRWAVEHPAAAQLMFWRPVPGFTPSAAAYAPAVETVAAMRAVFTVLRDRGLLRAQLDLDEAVGAWTVLITGVITLQLSNTPTEPDSRRARLPAFYRHW